MKNCKRMFAFFPNYLAIKSHVYEEILFISPLVLGLSGCDIFSVLVY